jgi:hypothetical protein
MKTTKTTKICALAILSILAASGCTSDAQSSSPVEASNEDQLIGFKGSVDHAAIVEVTTMMLVTGPTDFATVLDPYNQADPFNIGTAPYRATFAQNLAKFDVQDGKLDWTADQVTTWVSRVAAGNYQVIDTSKPCRFDNPHTYLEIERAQMAGTEHTTCGGRMPNEDAMDVTLNWLIRGPAAASSGEGAFGDGVDQATKPSVSTFPYLAELNGI